MCICFCMYVFIVVVIFQLAVLATVQRSPFQIAALAVFAQSGGLEPAVKRGDRGGIGETLTSRH